MSLLSPQTLIPLDNSIWPDADYLALALVLENNGRSIKVLPVHNEPAQAGKNDAIIARADSGLDFDIVAAGQQPLSLPVSAFAGDGSRISEKAFLWLVSDRQSACSVKSGNGVEQIVGSFTSRWRDGFIKAFEMFRLCSWRREFVKAGEEKAGQQALPALAVILQLAQGKAPGGALAAKSAKLTTKTAAKNTPGKHCLIEAASRLCSEMGYVGEQPISFENMGEADIFELLTNILRR